MSEHHQTEIPLIVFVLGGAVATLRHDRVPDHVHGLLTLIRRLVSC